MRNFVQSFHRTMEGEAQMLDAACFFFLLQRFKDMVFLNNLQPIQVQSVAQIEVKILHLAFFQLLFKIFQRILRLFHQPHGHFAGQMKALPRVFFQRLAHKQLAFTLMVRVSGIVVIDAVSIGIIDHLLRLGFVDIGFFWVDFGQTHTAEAQQRNLLVCVLVVAFGDHIGFLPFFPAGFVPLLSIFIVRLRVQCKSTLF